MLSHADIGGRCTGKLIVQSPRPGKQPNKMICNVCDFTVGVDNAKTQAKRQKLRKARESHAQQ